MRGIVSVKGKFHNHAGSPRVTAEQPVAQGGFHFGVCVIAGGFTVQPALGQHGGSQIVGTPDVGDTVQKGAFYRFLVRAFNARTHVADEFLADAAVVHFGKMVVPHVHERIPLVVACTVGAHPRSHRFATSVFKGLGQVFVVAGGFVQFHGSQFHIVHPVVLFVNVGRQDRGSLACSRFLYAFLIGGIGLGFDFCCKFRIVVFQYLGA